MFYSLSVEESMYMCKSLIVCRRYVDCSDKCFNRCHFEEFMYMCKSLIVCRRYVIALRNDLFVVI